MYNIKNMSIQKDLFINKDMISEKDISIASLGIDISLIDAMKILTDSKLELSDIKSLVNYSQTGDTRNLNKYILKNYIGKITPLSCIIITTFLRSSMRGNIVPITHFLEYYYNKYKKPKMEYVSRFEDVADNIIKTIIERENLLSQNIDQEGSNKENKDIVKEENKVKKVRNKKETKPKTKKINQ